MPLASEGAPDPVALLCKLLRLKEKRFTSTAFGADDRNAIANLLNLGAVVPDGIIDAIFCNECDTPHLAEVVRKQPNGPLGWHCPDAGFVVAALEAVAALSVQPPRIASLLSKSLEEVFGAKRRTTRPLEKSGAWVIGSWEISGVWTTVVLAGELREVSHRRALSEELATLTPNGAELVLSFDLNVRFEVEAPKRAIVPLEDVVTVDEEGKLSVFADLLASSVNRATEIPTNHSGRPSMGPLVHAFLDRLVADGANKTAITPDFVRRAWRLRRRGEPIPAASTLRLHIKTWRERA